MKKKIIIVRIIHALAALYFIFCIINVYITAITLNFSYLSAVAILSLSIEGFAVFILNKGDCPLIYIQRKINDPIPFFNLLLPPKYAKKAVPFFVIITLAGLIFLAVRFLLLILI